MAETAFIELKHPVAANSRDRSWGAGGKVTANKLVPLRFTKVVPGTRTNIHENINTEAEENGWLIHATTIIPDASSASLSALVVFERTPDSKG